MGLKQYAKEAVQVSTIDNLFGPGAALKFPITGYDDKGEPIPRLGGANPEREHQFYARAFNNHAIMKRLPNPHHRSKEINARWAAHTQNAKRHLPNELPPLDRDGNGGVGKYAKHHAMETEGADMIAEMSDFSLPHNQLHVAGRHRLPSDVSKIPHNAHEMLDDGGGDEGMRKVAKYARGSKETPEHKAFNEGAATRKPKQATPSQPKRSARGNWDKELGGKTQYARDEEKPSKFVESLADMKKDIDASGGWGNFLRSPTKAKPRESSHVNGHGAARSSGLHTHRHPGAEGGSDLEPIQHARDEDYMENRRYKNPHHIEDEELDSLDGLERNEREPATVDTPTIKGGGPKAKPNKAGEHDYPADLNAEYRRTASEIRKSAPKEYGGLGKKHGELPLSDPALGKQYLTSDQKVAPRKQAKAANFPPDMAARTRRMQTEGQKTTKRVDDNIGKEFVTSDGKRAPRKQSRMDAAGHERDAFHFGEKEYQNFNKAKAGALAAEHAGQSGGRSAHFTPMSSQSPKTMFPRADAGHGTGNAQSTKSARKPIIEKSVFLGGKGSLGSFGEQPAAPPKPAAKVSPKPVQRPTQRPAKPKKPSIYGFKPEHSGSAYEDAAHGKMARKSDRISPAKAKQILRDGEVRGHPLTEKQRGLFGAAAGRGR